MNLVPRPLRQPGTHLRVLVRCIIVDDKVNVQLRRNAFIETAQKSEKFLVTVARLAFAEYNASRDIQSGKQGRSPVAHIIMSHAFEIPEPHR